MHPAGLIYFAPAFAFNPVFTSSQLEELEDLMSSNQPHKTFKPPAKDRDTELFLYYGFVKDPDQSVYFKWALQLSDLCLSNMRLSSETELPKFKPKLG